MLSVTLRRRGPAGARGTASTAPAAMLIRVQTPDGQKRVEVPDACTFDEFKRAVESACGVRTWDQAFSRDIGGRQKIPDDGRSLRSLNVTHGEQLYLSDLSKSLAVYTAPADGAPATDAAPTAAPRGGGAPATAAPQRPPAGGAARATTSPPIDPLSAPAPSGPLAAATEPAEQERRPERKMAPMRRLGGAPPSMAREQPAAAPEWEMDM